MQYISCVCNHLPHIKLMQQHVSEILNRNLLTIALVDTKKTLFGVASYSGFQIIPKPGKWILAFHLNLVITSSRLGINSLAPKMLFGSA
jgi:hypothetical protein